MLANPGVFVPFALKVVSETDPSRTEYFVEWTVYTILGLLPLVMLSYGLTLAAAAETLKAHPGPLDASLAGLVFAATSIITIAAPVVILMIAPDRAAAVLGTWRDWVLAHSRSIALIALVLIGAAVIVRGAYDLAA